MPFTVESLALEGVLLVMPPRFLDERGYFMETYNRLSLSELGITAEFVQDNEAFSGEVGTLRGLHFQLSPHPQAKLVRVIRGAIFDVAVDVRPGSTTYGKWCSAVLKAETGVQMYVPVGFAHGYCTLEPDTLVAYKVDGFYNKNSEAGVHWDDPDIGIDWPISRNQVRLSSKDSELPRLRDARTPFQFYG